LYVSEALDSIGVDPRAVEEEEVAPLQDPAHPLGVPARRR
jgi:hypothetical protein